MLNMTPEQLPQENTGSSTPDLPAGVYPAVITTIIDLGIQKNKKYESRNKPDESCTDDDFTVQHELWFSFSLPTERFEIEKDGEVTQYDQVIGKKYKVSNFEKSNLMQMYKALVTDRRPIGEMIGMPCTLTTGTTDGGNAKVMNVAAPMRGMSVGEPLRDPIVVGENDWDNVDNLDLPDFLKNMIKNREVE